MLLLAVWIALASGLSRSSADDGARPQQWIVYITAGTPQLRTQLIRQGLDIVSVDLQGVTARLTPAQLRALEQAGFLCQVLEAGAQSIPVDDLYHSLAETEAELQAVAAQHPDIARLEVIRWSVEGRPIYALKVSDRAQEDEWSEPAVLIFALAHAREHLSTEMALDILHMLIEGYGRSGEITNLVHQREIWIIPDLNPDGDVYDTESGYYRFWRKNRRPNPGGSFGVDLNRNFGYRWGCCGGSSPSPWEETYRGPAPFSEPESTALRDFVESHPNITVSLSLHSYGEWILWPYGYTYESPPADMRPQDYEAFRRLAGAMADLNGYRAIQASQLYLADGTADDWLYGAQGIFAFTFELYPRTPNPGFYPPGTVIPAETARNRPAVLYLLRMADNPRKVVGEGGDLTPPQVALTAPAAGAYVSGPLAISADASDDIGVTLVEFIADGRTLGLDEEPPFALVWEDVPAVGSARVWVRAYDAGGNTAESPPVLVHFAGSPPGYFPIVQRQSVTSP
jgi:hypothetical protein